jgi:serine/threonine protein kinase
MKSKNLKIKTLCKNSTNVFKEINSLQKSSDSHKLIQNLVYENSICDLIKNKFIKLGTKLGSGNFGAVYDATVNNEDVHYAVKEASIETIILIYDKKTKISLNDYAIKFLPEFDKKILISFNGNKPAKILTPGTQLHYPSFLFSQIADEDIVIFPYREAAYNYIIPKGSFICKDSSLSEYLINIFISNLYSQQLCKNFVFTFAHVMCKDKHYMFMERIDGDLDGIINKIRNPHDIDSIISQILFALYTMDIYSINHNDLHLKNVFISYFDTLNKTNKSEKTDKVNIAYKISINEPDDKTNYFLLKDSPFMVKIGDFGISCKYNTRFDSFHSDKSPSTSTNGNDSIFDKVMVLNDYVVMQKMNPAHSWNSKYMVPNFYSHNYDLIYFIFCMYSRCLIEKIPISKYLKKILSFILKIDYLKFDDNNVSRMIMAVSENLRPLVFTLKELFSHVKVSEILFNSSISGDFIVKGKHNLPTHYTILGKC